LSFFVYFGRAIILLEFCRNAFFEKSRFRKIAISRLFRNQFQTCNNFARILLKCVFRKKSLAYFAVNIRCSWYQWIQNCQAHHFLTGLQMYSHFWENGRWITKDKKIDLKLKLCLKFYFLRFSVFWDLEKL
jgi:hypothetical protein